jgi:hypothetical protein
MSQQTFNNGALLSAVRSVINGNAAEAESRLAALESGKQATLVAGTNIKTINGSSLLGSGNLLVGGLSYDGTIRTSNTTMNTGNIYIFDTIGGNITATLPATPGNGDEIEVWVKPQTTPNTNQVTFGLNGKQLNGGGASLETRSYACEGTTQNLTALQDAFITGLGCSSVAASLTGGFVGFDTFQSAQISGKAMTFYAPSWGSIYFEFTFTAGSGCYWEFWATTNANVSSVSSLVFAVNGSSVSIGSALETSGQMQRYRISVPEGSVTIRIACGPSVSHRFDNLVIANKTASANADWTNVNLWPIQQGGACRVKYSSLLNSWFIPPGMYRLKNKL